MHQHLEQVTESVHRRPKPEGYETDRCLDMSMMHCRKHLSRYHILQLNNLDLPKQPLVEEFKHPNMSWVCVSEVWNSNKP